MPARDKSREMTDIVEFRHALLLIPAFSQPGKAIERLAGRRVMRQDIVGVEVHDATARARMENEHGRLRTSEQQQEEAMAICFRSASTSATVQYRRHLPSN